MKTIRVLIAPNAFKHSLNATDVALAIQEGLQKSNLDCVCECFPVGDGGDGTGELMIKKHNGLLISAEVNDPFDRKITSSFGLVNEGETAVIEMANASGLHLVKHEDLNPLRATSFGTGELMKLALDKGVTQFVLAIGGSATVDGGTGILRALGIRFLDAAGRELTAPETLTELAKIDVSGLDQRILGCDINILCDVDNTLIGEHGSAAVFGPQKGATPEGVKILDASLSKFADVALSQTGIDMTTVIHGGAAGGVAAGLYTFLNAKLVNGIDFFLAFTGFDDAVAKADIVITGEGSIDEQTLHGKGPYGVAYQAKQKNLPVIGIAGKIPLEQNDKLNQYFDVLLAIGNGPADITTALKYARENLVRTAWQVGNLLAVKP
ncbi:glycerate kinase [Spirosoma endophyticum]|uniref:Glycerate kinase n=1 Tax=Spirosoma endophyticum TaxID=662367 RepID=A0A1I1PJS3_9BACT|nr:glycerate kinase [Spirosoma endophyticum]SFD10119.1 glycerate kinase [Spirosoma endophyticum]